MLRRMFALFGVATLAVMLATVQAADEPAKAEEREKAQMLKDAIKLANESGVDVRFQKLIDLLQKSKASNLQEVKEAIDQAELLTQNMRAMLALLLTNSRDAQLKAEKDRIQNILKELNKVIREQKVVRAQTERGSQDQDQLAKNQDKVTDQTKDIAGALGGNKDGKGGEGKNAKGETKGEGKNKGEGRGEGKEDTKGSKGEGKSGDGKEGKEGKSGDGKQGDGKQGEGKQGDSKEGKSGEGKSGEGKQGDGKSGEGKSGDPKSGDGKAGEGKQGDGKSGEGKSGEAKSGDKGGDPKAGDGKGKAGEGKQGDPKAGDGKGGEGKQGDPKAGDGKGGEGKPGDPKGGKAAEGKGQPQGKGQAKGGEGKGGEGKPGEGKPSDSKGGDSKGGDSKGGKPGQSKGGDSKGGDSKGGDGKGGDGKGGQSPPQQPQQPMAPGKKQIEDAIANQKKAQEEIAKKNNSDASNQQDDAIKNLDEARKRLEEILKQLREEEMERLLAQLQARCEYMLQMQKEVLEGTLATDKTIGGNADKKASRADEQKSQQLSDREGLIVTEAKRARGLLESEGSAVAFAEAFTGLIDDMSNVQKRLNKTDVGLFTQKVERDIIQTLEEMIEALKKAQQEMKAQAGKPGPPGPQGQPPPQKLIDQLAELKMIRSMQLRVNKRTEDYGKLYPEEQADDRDVQKELRGLADRQDRIKKIAVDIATGKNQ